MKKLLTLFIFIVYSFSGHSQYIQELSISPENNGAIEVDLLAEVGGEYLSSSYEIEDNTIQVTVCYAWWLPGVTEEVETIVLVEGLETSIEYTLVVDLYGSGSEEECDFHELTDTFSGEFSTPLEEEIVFIENLHTTTYKKTRVDLYPNPSSNTTTISLPKNEAFDLVLYTMLGKKVFKKKNLSEFYDLTVSSYPEGIYFVHLRGENSKNIRKKLIVKR